MNTKRKISLNHENKHQKTIKILKNKTNFPYTKDLPDESTKR